MPWYAKATGGYSESSTEGQANAWQIYDVLTSCGWSINPICGVIGNIAHEGGLNPWRWQSDNVQSSGGSPWTSIGYGFTQFTPASKYIDASTAKSITGYGPNFSDKTGNVYDGYAQILWLDTYADYYSTSTYPMSYSAYKVTSSSPGTCALIWLYNYERPASPASTASARQASSEYFYELFTGESPPSPDNPGGGGGGGGSAHKAWLLGSRLPFIIGNR